MNRTLGLLLPMALLGFTISCSRGGGVGAPDTREADVKAVKDLEIAWVKDAAAKDPDRFAGYYADDASLLMPGQPVVTGKAAILPVARQMLADPNFALTFQSTRVEASKGGDMVYSQGSYNMTMSDEKTKKPVNDKGKYLTVFKKQADGSWKAVADMINSDGATPAGH
jgi:uncharacterized protein (TIGR02246 family)